MKERIPEVRAAPPDDDERSAGGVARGAREVVRRGVDDDERSGGGVPAGTRRSSAAAWTRVS